MAIDPVCGMEVDEQEAKYKTEYKGKTYYFCAEMCKEKFEKTQRIPQLTYSHKKGGNP
ncbi:MAG: YHS domain-containing protein [Thermoproteota archaeon]